jgi:hypothetical protein
MARHTARMTKIFPACLLATFLLLSFLPAPARAGDGTCAVGAPQAALKWYFAEGYTGPGFREYLCVFNPGDMQAAVKVSLLYPDAPPGLANLPVPPRSRATLDVNAAVGRETDVSLTVESDQPVVAERPMYFTYRNGWEGCTNVLGAMAPAGNWSFAEGTTRAGFEEWICLANPGSDPAEVEVKLALEDGSLIDRKLSIPAHQRRTIDVNAAVGPERDVSAYITSGKDILAERAMYFDYRGRWQGGHASFGQPLDPAAASRYFAEGYTGAGFETWLCLFFPSWPEGGGSSAAATIPVTLTFMFEDGSTRVEAVDLPVNQRATYYLNQWLGEGKNVSVRVDGQAGLLAERPMYFNYKGTCRGGHVTSGAISPQTTWNFAEGTLRPGFEEWLCLLNPNGEAAEVDIDCYSNEGDSQTIHYSVAPTSRFTRNLNDALPSFLGKDVSCIVRSSQPLVAERSLYYPGASFEAQNAMDNLAYLTQAIGPRVEGSAGERAAADFLAAGLGSCAANGNYYDTRIQDIPLPDGTDTHNVVGKLTQPAQPASVQAARSLLILGAHFDTKRDTGSPGANDNGSGSVTILELARCFAQAEPGVEVWIVFFGGEEQMVTGTDLHHYGSRYFVDNLSAADRARLRGFVSVDMVGVGSQLYARTMGIGPMGFCNELMSFASTHGIYLPYLVSGSSSDHEPFEKAGLPAVWLEYKDDPYYHTPQDSIDKIDPAYIELTGSLLLGFLLSL